MADLKINILKSDLGPEFRILVEDLMLSHLFKRPEHEYRLAELEY